MRALAPVRSAEPASPILSIADAKAHLRITSSDEDALLEAYVSAAQSYLDGCAGVLGQALITQEWEQSFDGFPAGDRFRLPLGPLHQVDEISYFDAAGEVQTFTAFYGVTDAIGPMVVLNGNSWPVTAARPDAVTVKWTCGFGDEGVDIPTPLIQAAKLLIGEWHLNRANSTTGSGFASVAELPFAVRTLIAPYRRVGI